MDTWACEENFCRQSGGGMIVFAETTGIGRPESPPDAAPDALQPTSAARVAKMQAGRQKLSAAAAPPMTAEEIEAEIKAYRAERRRAAGA